MMWPYVAVAGAYIVDVPTAINLFAATSTSPIVDDFVIVAALNAFPGVASIAIVTCVFCWCLHALAYFITSAVAYKPPSLAKF